jgi:branched-chain amino acid transport system substrate-binding protein
MGGNTVRENLSLRCLFVLAALIGAAVTPTSFASADEDGGVKIGVLNDSSSVYASVGGLPLVTAAKMAVEDFGGQVLGKPIEVVSGDTQLKPDIASGIARKWMDEDHVDMITDLVSTNIALAVKALANERKKVLIATSPASSILTGKECSPYLSHWTYDTYSNALSLGSALLAEGGKKWFILSQDTVTGTVTEKDLSDFLTAHGGSVVGVVRAPVDGTDFSSYLLQAQASGADVLAVLPAGNAGVSVLKQAREFGLPQSGMKIVSFFMMPDDVKALGLDSAQGLYFTTAFVWNLNDETKAFSERFLKRTGKMPNMNMVGTYSAVRHYLEAVKAAGTKDADAVMAKMRELPVKDVFTKDGTLRADGRMAHSMFVVQVKSLSASTGEWDLFKVVSEVPTEQVVRPLKDGGCPLVK